MISTTRCHTDGTDSLILDLTHTLALYWGLTLKQAEKTYRQISGKTFSSCKFLQTVHMLSCNCSVNCMTVSPHHNYVFCVEVCGRNHLIILKFHFPFVCTWCLRQNKNTIYSCFFSLLQTIPQSQLQWNLMWNALFIFLKILLWNLSSIIKLSMIKEDLFFPHRRFKKFNLILQMETVCLIKWMISFKYRQP